MTQWLLWVLTEKGFLMGSELGASLAVPMGIRLDLTVPQSPPATACGLLVCEGSRAKAVNMGCGKGRGRHGVQVCRQNF